MRRLFFIVIYVTSLLKLSAQARDSNMFKFGFKVAVNYCMMNFNKSPAPPSTAIKNSWNPGFNVGFLLQLPVNKYLTLQPEYAYARMRGEDDRTQASYNINYLSLPVLLKILVSKRIAILAGPEFDLLIHANRYEKGLHTNIEHEIEERNFSGVIGLEAKVIKWFYLDARFMKGFSHVGLNDHSTGNEFKWSGLALGAQVKF